MEILKHALTLAGATEEQINSLVSNEALSSIEVPEELTVKVKNSLTNLERAKAHPDIANHFKGTHFGLVDKATKEALTGLGLDESQIAEVFNGKKTAERLQEAIRLSNEIGSKKAGQSTNAQIEELRTALNQAKTAQEAKEAELLNQLQAQKQAFEQLNFNNALSSAIQSSGLKFMALDNDVLNVSANHLINKGLAEIGAKAKAENGKIKLVRLDDEGQEHYTGAEKTDFYKLLPAWLGSLVDKSNATTTTTATTINATPKSRAERARLNNMKTLIK